MPNAMLNDVKMSIEEAKKLTTFSTMEFVATCALVHITTRAILKNTSLANTILFLSMPWFTLQLDAFVETHELLNGMLKNLETIDMMEVHLLHANLITRNLNIISNVLKPFQAASTATCLWLAYQSRDAIISAAIRSLPARK